MTDTSLWIAPDGTVVYIDPNESEPQGIKYIRASELAKAYEAIVELVDAYNDPKFHSVDATMKIALDRHKDVIKTAREHLK